MALGRYKESEGDVLRVLAGLDRRWRRVAENRMTEHFTKLLSRPEFSKITKVLAWPAEVAGEADVTKFLLALPERVGVYVARSHIQGDLVFISVDPGGQGEHEAGRRFVPDPVTEGEEVLILVPGLVFDREGHRVGVSGDYYERFLRDKRLDRALKVGVCWSLQVVNHVPGPQMLDWLIDERSVYQMNSVTELHRYSDRW